MNFLIENMGMKLKTNVWRVEVNIMEQCKHVLDWGSGGHVSVFSSPPGQEQGNKNGIKILCIKLEHYKQQLFEAKLYW